MSVVNTRASVYPPLYAAISANTSGDTTVISAVPGKAIRVMLMAYVCHAAVVLTWKSGTSGAITGPESYADHGGLQSPYCEYGVMQTGVGESLVINLSDAVSVGGKLTYVLV